MTTRRGSIRSLALVSLILTSCLAGAEAGPMLAAGGGGPVAPVFRGNPGLTGGTRVPAWRVTGGRSGQRLRPHDTPASGADQPGYNCSGGPSQDNSSEYSGPVVDNGYVSGDTHTFAGRVDSSGNLRIRVTNNNVGSGHWLESRVSAATWGGAANFDWGFDRTDANFFYNYNMTGFHWDGSQWTLHYSQNNYATLSVQPGLYAYMAVYIDCSLQYFHWYLGSSPNQLTEVYRLAYSQIPPWYVGADIHGVTNSAVTVTNGNYSVGIPGSMSIANWNGGGTTVDGAGYTPLGTAPTTAETLGGGSRSENSTTPSTACPVNCATGEFWHAFDDLSVPGRGIPLDLSQTYSSLNASQDSPLGFGWTDSYNMYLSSDGSGNLSVHEEGGSVVTFIPAGSTYLPPSRVLASLVKNGDGTLMFTRLQGRDQFAFAAPANGGQLLNERDRNGYATTLSYTNGRLSTVTDLAGRSLSFQYNASNRVASVTDTAGRSVSFSYDTNGNLTDIIDVRGGHWHLTYDGSHRLLTIEDPRQYAANGALSSGPVTTNVYDTQSRAAQQTDEMGHKTTFGYVTNGDGTQTNTITDPNGVSEVQTYRNDELLTDVAGSGTSVAATTSFAYDPVTLGVTSITDPNNHISTASYDGNGNTLSATDPLNHTATYAYDSLGDLTSITGPDSVTTLTYDSYGNALTLSRPLTGTGQTATTRLTYGDPSHRGDVTQVTDPNGHSTTLAYDAGGDVAGVTDPMGDTTTYAYDSAGNVTSQTAPRGNPLPASRARFTSTATYDAAGNVLSTADPVGNVTQYSYDANGDLTQVLDPAGHSTGYAYDPAGELTRVTQADGTAQSFTYDAVGNVLSQALLSSSGGTLRTVGYTYDPLSRVATMIDPGNRVSKLTYDLAGNVTAYTDQMNRTTNYSYDSANEPTNIAFHDAGTHDIALTYTTLGQRATMADGTGTSTYTYDSLGRLTKQINGAGAEVDYAYDLAGNLTSLAYPSSAGTVTRTYDAANRVTDIQDWLGHNTHFSYDANSNLTGESLPSGTNTKLSFAYDNADRLKQIVAAGSAGTNPFHWLFGYGRDPLGQVSGSTDRAPGMRHSYTYDQLNRLTQDLRANRTATSWTYDAANNLRTAQDTATGITKTLTYDANYNQITGMQSTGSSSQSLGFAYNGNGDRTTTTDLGTNATLDTYGYNQADQLTSLTQGSTSSSYS